MCGIVALLDPTITGMPEASRHPLAGDVARLTGCLTHRGPDGSGVWVCGPVALGHTRLSILDLSSAGAQPMSFKGRYWISYNGEVYNFIELREELKTGHTFHTGTDTEVILAAYDRWGPSCVERFNGMFAFVIWDVQEKRAFGARDRLGVKPLYFARCSSTGKVALASEIKALRRLSWCNGAPNSQRLFDFLLDRVLDHTDETMFSGIFQVRPGHRFTWSPGGGLSTEQYWRYEPTGDQRPESRVAYDTVRQLFTDSVRIRLRSDVPVGALLSGGLDSSSVFCAARLHDKDLVQPVCSVSTRVVPRTDENALIDQLVEGRAAWHFEDTPTMQAIEDDLQDLVYVQDEPFGDGSMLAHFRLMRLAHEHGLKVILSGQGGDEFWDGYYGSVSNGLAGLVHRRRFTEALSLGREFSRRHSFNRHRVLLDAVGHSLPTEIVDWFRERLFSHTTSWIAPDYFKECARKRQPEETPRWADPYTKYLYNVATAWTLPGFLHFEDRNSMHFGIEMRLPFLDWRLVEYAGSLDPTLKMAGGETKHIIREALRGITPEAILRRHRKQPFPVPIDRWLRESRGLYDNLIEASRHAPFANPQNVERLIGRFLARDRRVSAATIWRMLSSLLWHERFFRC